MACAGQRMEEMKLNPTDGLRRTTDGRKEVKPNGWLAPDNGWKNRS
jgi:hypothetical protein